MDERERQYREYLALRKQNHDGEAGQDLYNQKSDEKYGKYFAENINRERPERRSVTGTPYGSSELRKKQKEKERRDAEMREYLSAREADRQKRGVRSGTGTARSSKLQSSKPNGSKPHGSKPKKVKKGKSKGLRIAVIALIVILVGSGATLLGGTVMALNALGSMQKISLDENALGIDPGVAQDLDGYRNIAILGTDARADQDDSQCRSDAIIIASINEETNEVKMFSVYRDTMLDLGDEGLDKITHAYFYGGAQQSLYALNKNLDLNIDEVCVINWKTVADIIDSVDGIEIDVQESELDELNKYIHETAKNVDGPDTKVESAGKQTLNGVQAVTYARIRKDALTGDYRRNERMKIVFKQTFKKVRSSGPLKMFGVAKSALPEIKTNLTAKDILGMMIKFKSYDMTDSTTGFPYDVGSWTGYGGAGYAWYGPPVNLANNVSKLHKQFFGQNDYTPTETVQQISNDISYKTGIY